MSAAPTLANLTDGESAARRAALRLHALTPFDRAWLLARLTPAERVRVEPLRAELVALRIPAATAQVADSPAGVGADFTAPKRSGEPGRQASHHGVGPAANGDFGRPAHGGAGAAGSATGRTAASAGLDGAADVDALAGVASVDAVAGVDGTDRGCDAARALRVLVTLPPGLATAILAAAPWSWRDALLARESVRASMAANLETLYRRSLKARNMWISGFIDGAQAAAE